MRARIARLLHRLYDRGLDVPLLGSILDQYSSLRLLRDRKLALLAVANFLDAMSTTIIVPLLPAYAEQLGASAFLVGIIFAAPEISEAVLNAPFGHVADRTNRRRWIVAGMVLGALSVVLLGFVGIPLAFVGLRALDGVGRAMKSPATDAYIGDVAPDDERGSAFGAYRTLGMLGMAVGPAIGGALAAVGDISTPFVVLGLGTLLGGLALLVALPAADDATEGADEVETEEDELEEGASDEVASGEAESDESGIFDVSTAEFRSMLSVPVTVFLLDSFVSSVGTNAFSAFFALLLKEQYAVGSAYTGLAWSMFGLAMFVFVPVGGTVADRAGRKPTLILSKVGWAVVAFGLATASRPVLSLVLLSIGGAASAFMIPAWSSVIYELAPDGMEGTANGFNRSLSSAGSALGPVIGGAVIEWSSVQFVFYGIGAIWVLTAVDVAAFIPETRTAADSPGDETAEATD